MSIFSKLSKLKLDKRVREHKAKNSAARNTFLLNEDSPFNLTEAFRDLKMRISVSVPKSSGGTVISMTSAFPNEGKTTVAVNLALMFAYSNAKVLVIDADLRKGRVHKYFSGKSECGLSDYISSQCKKEDIIRPTDVAPNLFYVSCGTHSPRPYELLESVEMKNFIEELKEEFDYVIIDTPPALVVSDTLAVSAFVDGVVFVCRHESSYMSDVSRALSSLRFAKANVLGVVVNGYDSKTTDYRGGGSKHYYYTAYGYNDTKTEDK